MTNGSFSGARFRHAFSDIEARDLEHAKERIKAAIEKWGMKFCYIETVWLKPGQEDDSGVQERGTEGKDGAVLERRKDIPKGV